jgi:hypothetical protein
MTVTVVAGAATTPWQMYGKRLHVSWPHRTALPHSDLWFRSITLVFHWAQRAS